MNFVFFAFYFIVIIFIFLCDFYFWVFFACFWVAFLFMQKNPLFEFDLKIERTFHKLKRQRALLTAFSMIGGEEA